MKRFTQALLLFTLASGGVLVTGCQNTGSGASADDGVLGGSVGPRQPRYTRGQAIDADFYDQIDKDGV